MRQENGPVAQRLEEGTHNSRKSFCAYFHRLAHRCERLVNRQLRFAVRNADLRRFAAKNRQTVENDREKLERRNGFKNFWRRLLLRRF